MTADNAASAVNPALNDAEESSDVLSAVPVAPAAPLADAVIDPIQFTSAKMPRISRKWSPIESVAIENFKAIDSATIPLSRVTILVGPNGSGKSSVLQAIHWAARSVSYILPKNGKEMISFDRIDYLPSSEPLKTAYKSELKPSAVTRPTRVLFNHTAVGEEQVGPTATISIWAARNKGGITAHLEGGSVVSPYKQRSAFITAYIPGLAGLSERETILAQPSLRRQAASGDAGGVLRNILLSLRVSRTNEESGTGEARLARLNQLIQSVHPSITLRVAYDEREDFNISASYEDSRIGGGYHSLESAATGVLQAVQIFAYLVLFRPRVMLIDEPDAHLHPDKQERLIEALEAAALEFDTQVVLTTHSPHIARAASPSTKLIWMSDGSVKTDDDGAIRQLMGWGGLDKHALFFVEDEDDKAIRAILKQWPDLARKLAICRCFGVDNLPKDTLLRGMLVDGKIGLKALIHRDRDFMIDEEVSLWIDLYKTEGVELWISEGCDVEAEFCKPDYLSALYGVPIEEAEDWCAKAAANVSGARKTFLEKRRVIARVVRPDGGGPDSTKLWDETGQTPETVVGKDLWKQLKPIIQAANHDDKLLNSFTIPNGYVVAPTLKALLEKVTATSSKQNHQ